MKTFAAPPDRFTRMLTLGAGAIVLIAVASLGWELLDSRPWEIGAGWPMLAAALVLLAAPVIAFGYRPASYAITDTALLIRRPFGAIVLPLKDISGTMRVGTHDLGVSVRLFGSGGFFGYFGLYTSSRFGKVTWYATRRDDFVFVEMNNGKKYLLTPDYPAAMVKMLG